MLFFLLGPVVSLTLISCGKYKFANNAGYGGNHWYFYGQISIFCLLQAICFAHFYGPSENSMDAFSWIFLMHQLLTRAFFISLRYGYMSKTRFRKTLSEKVIDLTQVTLLATDLLHQLGLALLFYVQCKTLL